MKIHTEMRKWGFVLSCAVVMLTACGIGQDDQTVFVKVDPEFNVGIIEQLDTHKALTFVIQTIEPQPCSNNTIDFEYGQTSNEILINVKNIVQAENCIPWDSIIETSANMSPLANGKIDLALILKNTVTGAGTLTVDDEKYQLEIDEGHGFLAKENTLYKIPMGAAWGYITYNGADFDEVANSLREEIVNATMALSLKEGYYGHFKINGERTLELHQEAGQLHENTFTFYRQLGNATPEALRSILNSYRSEFSEQDLIVKLFTWDGQKL